MASDIPKLRLAIRIMPKLPRALGAEGITIEKKADVAQAVKKMLAYKKGPFVVDFRTSGEENVWPMVPAGKCIDEMDGLDIIESMA